MKQLKSSTIKRYTARSLAKHLARLMDRETVAAPFRVDLAYSTLYRWSEEHSCYLFLCNIAEYSQARASIIEAIQDSYRKNAGVTA